jgi:phosphoglycolate phosphatase-like HAD superfamily hydrolase
VIEAYLARLERELIAAADRYVVYPGVVELLERAQGLEQVAVGLGTGNVERGARLKLQPGDLNRLFRFGGFGSDATERAEVLRIGATRGAALLQQPVEACRVVVIGDTPRDVEAALAIGAECLAVATGNYARETLLESGAHLAVEDLTAKEAAELLEA